MTIYKLEYRKNEKSHSVLVGYYPNYTSVNEQANQLLDQALRNKCEIITLITME